MKELTRNEMKKVMGGLSGADYCGGKKLGDCCNTYCGEGSHVTCNGLCSVCDPAGGGQNPNVPGGDRLCTSF